MIGKKRKFLGYLFFLLGVCAPLIGFGAEPLNTAKDFEQGSIYSPVGKRDPFKPPAPGLLQDRDLASLAPLEQFSIEQLQLKGVLHDGKSSARALFEDPSGGTYILRQGDRMGKEHATVSRILNTEVIVTEKTYNYLGVESLYEKVISLPQK